MVDDISFQTYQGSLASASPLSGLQEKSNYLFRRSYIGIYNKYSGSHKIMPNYFNITITKLLVKSTIITSAIFLRKLIEIKGNLL